MAFNPIASKGQKSAKEVSSFAGLAVDLRCENSFHREARSGLRKALTQKGILSGKTWQNSGKLAGRKKMEVTLTKRVKSNCQAGVKCVILQLQRCPGLGCMKFHAIRNKCHASSNKCLTSSNKKLLERLLRRCIAFCCRWRLGAIAIAKHPRNMSFVSQLRIRFGPGAHPFKHNSQLYHD